MATPRKRLVKKINPTRGKKGHLSSEGSPVVMHALLSGEKVSTLATYFRCYRNTIRNTMKRYCETDSLEDKSRTGACPRLTIREKRALYRRLRQNPEMPYAQLQTWVKSTTGKKVSRRTVRHALHATGLRHWKSLKLIYLDKKVIQQRREYTRE
jgi:transposase